MHSLLGDRFLKRFAGEIRRNQKHPTSIIEGQNSDAGDDEVINPTQNDAAETHANDAADNRETRQGSNENTSEVDNE